MSSTPTPSLRASLPRKAQANKTQSSLASSADTPQNGSSKPKRPPRSAKTATSTVPAEPGTTLTSVAARKFAKKVVQTQPSNAPGSKPGKFTKKVGQTQFSNALKSKPGKFKKKGGKQQANHRPINRSNLKAPNVRYTRIIRKDIDLHRVKTVNNLPAPAMSPAAGRALQRSSNGHTLRIYDRLPLVKTDFVNGIVQPEASSTQWFGPNVSPVKPKGTSGSLKESNLVKRANFVSEKQHASSCRPSKQMSIKYQHPDALAKYLEEDVVVESREMPLLSLARKSWA